MLPLIFSPLHLSLSLALTPNPWLVCSPAPFEGRPEYAGLKFYRAVKMLEYNRGPAASPRPGRETFVGVHASAAAVAAAAGSGGRDGDGEEECLLPVMYRVGDTALLAWPREEPDEAVAVLRIYALYEVGKFSKKKR